ncbi:Transcription factor spt20 [Entomophthora muscae]|uniref:Transcription factor spt20 n=1 Tax=Entomophthora muscae TaxID=34485 RepID=A0ACC2TBF4_9FUNG|nr:Transcription factor spt20 [Entomophthora muscae]
MVAPESFTKIVPTTSGSQIANQRSIQSNLTCIYPDEMSFPKKGTPEWLKAASNNLPSSNFTVPKTLPGTGSKANQKSRRKSSIKKEAQSLVFDSKKDKNGLVMHVWDKMVRFEKEDKTFLFNSTWECISRYIEASEIPEEFVPILADANCDFYKGNLFVKFVDYRSPEVPIKGSTHDSEQPRVKTIVLKPTQRSILADVVHISKHSTEPITPDLALRLESELLVLYNPALDLRVDEASVTIKLAMQNIESSRVPPKIKCMKNSSEVEAEEAGKKEMKELLLSMNETRPKREFTEAIAEVRKKHMQKKTVHIQAPDSKKTKAKKPPQDDVPPGFKHVRLIQFERDSNDGKIYTSINFYEGPGGRFKVIVRYGSPSPSMEESGSNEIYLDTVALAESYATSFIDHFSIMNTLISDSKKPTITENIPALPKNPESVPIEPSSEIPVSTPQPATLPKEPTAIPASAAMSPLKDQSPSALLNQMTPQQLAEFQMARGKQLFQQKMHQHLENTSPHAPQNLTPPRPVSQTPMLLPQFPGFQYSAAQLQQIQQIQQQNFQNLVNTQQQALRQQSAMMHQDLTPQQHQILAAQRKQQFEALRMKPGMTPQEMRPSPAQPVQRPQMSQPFTPAQRQALDALQAKQVLSPAQNQALDALLLQPILPKQRQFLLNLRAQANAANPTPTPDTQASQQGSVEPSSTPKIPTPQQPSTPQQVPQPVPQQPQAQIPQQQQFMPQQQPTQMPLNFATPIRSAAQIQQSFTPQQQQAFAALQQQGLNPHQLKIMYMLQQRPPQNHAQQALLKTLQTKHAQNSYQLQAFLAQALKHNKQAYNVQQMAQSSAMSPGTSNPTSQMQVSTSHLSPQEQHTIRLNQIQQQQTINAHLQAQMQAQFQRQAQLQYQNIQQQRPFLRPNMQQQQLMARLQQQGMLNSMSQMPQQLMPLNMVQAMHPLRPGMPTRNDTMAVNPHQSPLPPGKMQQGSQQPPTN